MDSVTARDDQWFYHLFAWVIVLVLAGGLDWWFGVTG
jgi:hypothetical protein